MKARNLVLGLMLATNVLTAHSAIIVPHHSNKVSSVQTMASTVQNTVVVEYLLKNKKVKENNQWVETIVPSL